MRLYRIASKDYPIFDATGARLHGGRWNSPGVSVIYCSPNLSCARLEVMANLGLKRMPINQAFVKVNVPSASMEEWLDVQAIPPNWRDASSIHITRNMGDAWVKSGSSLVLRVPSAASPLEFNALINPQHPEFGKLAISAPMDIDWDPRLFGG